MPAVRRMSSHTNRGCAVEDVLLFDLVDRGVVLDRVMSNGSILHTQFSGHPVPDECGLCCCMSVCVFGVCDCTLETDVTSRMPRPSAATSISSLPWFPCWVSLFLTARDRASDSSVSATKAQGEILKLLSLSGILELVI